MMYSTSPVDIHMVADTEVQHYIEGLFDLVPRPLHDTRLFWYPVSWADMEARLDRTAQGKPDMPLYSAVRSMHQAGYREFPPNHLGFTVNGLPLTMISGFDEG